MASISQWLDKATHGPAVDPDRLKEKVTEALRGIYDPEIPVNIYDLGLIYKLDVGSDGAVDVQMTLTTPGCPVAQTFPGTVENTIRQVDGVAAAHVELVWNPPWCVDNLSDEVKLQLGLL